MAKQYNIPNLPKDYSDASQIEKWMSGIQKLFQSKSDADNKKEKEIEDSINSSACTEDAVKDILNANGEAPIYACRAWVNFNGTGTLAIRGSGNVSSVEDDGAGEYTVNFTTPIKDTNYSVFVDSDAVTNWCASFNACLGRITTRASFYHCENGVYKDTTNLCMAVFR